MTLDKEVAGVRTDQESDNETGDELGDYKVINNNNNNNNNMTIITRSPRRRSSVCWAIAWTPTPQCP